MSLAGRIGIIFARKWIGGTTVSDALGAAAKLNAVGEKVIINYLGEELTDKAKVSKTVRTYIEIIRRMKSESINGCIAVKPTQLGLNISYSEFESNYEKIVEYAERMGIFVWMDMEDYITIDRSIKAYLHVLKKRRNAGICIQSKLLRSYQDIRRISKHRGIIRLVKGAYASHYGITYMKKTGVDNNYLKCMNYLFKSGSKFMVATHDDKMIGQARRLEARAHRRTMFGMLKGIRPSLARALIAEHEDVYIYVPFGEEWLEYSLRRLKELEHSMLILRSLISS